MNFLPDTNRVSLITCNLKLVAIIKGPLRALNYHYFDSHSLDENGCPSSDGCTCIITFQAIRELSVTILANFFQAKGGNELTNFYTLVPLIITSHRPLEPRLQEQQPTILLQEKRPVVTRSHLDNDAKTIVVAMVSMQATNAQLWQLLHALPQL